MKEVYFDIETADAEDLFTYGPGFCRLAGVAVNDGPVILTTDWAGLVKLIESADEIYAHNGLGFDLLALEKWHGLDLAKLVEEGRVRDTLIMARHDDPPRPGFADSGRYKLEDLGQRFFGEGKLVGKSGKSALDELADEFGGFDKIPVDDTRYKAYLIQDVELTRRLAKQLPWDDYLEREHRALYRFGFISKVGFRVDIEAVEKALEAQKTRTDALVLEMHTKYGLPLSTALKRSLGHDVPASELKKPIVKPEATNAGKKALEKAFEALGVQPPRTKTGELSTSKDSLDKKRKAHPDNQGLQELCDAIGSLTGVRSVVKTIAETTRSDGRVHPSVMATQATGRFSVTKPGLTVMGKKKRKNLLERAFLLPDDGERLVCVDLATIDARAMAAHSQDENYMKVLEPGKDLHTEMAVTLFGDAARRSDAKPVTHATSYGMGPDTLAEYAGIPLAEATTLLKKLELRFPKLTRFKDQARREGKATGFIWNAFGRPIRVELERVHTSAPASYGQGTARDLLVEGVLRLPEETLPWLRAVIHDELVFSIPEDQVESGTEKILNALQFMFQVSPDAIGVPILAEVTPPGRDWADCYREDAPWPEVAWEHRNSTETCTDSECVFHH